MRMGALALMASLFSLGNAQAEEIGYSELAARLAALEGQVANQTGMQQAGYLDGCCDTGCCDTGCCDTGCCDTGCCDTGCCEGGWSAGVEMTFLRGHKADGFSQEDIFGFEADPRLTLQYTAGNGAGIRLRYWQWDHAVANGHNGNLTSADTYNIDLEVFREVNFGSRTSVEFNGGIRYNDYRDENFAQSGDETSFHGIGGVFGVKGKVQVGCRGSVYARARWAILMGDANDDGDVEYNVTRDHQEIGIGYERDVCLMGIASTINVGGEWQSWDQYEDNSEGAIGFAGFVIGVNSQF